ncbi:probable polygalacturonase At1g80170 isoform X2 [Eucalyptus grandis]|uniref:probable polygalacturonase At1g80170 isoform X2 n=1 Tax=Eucalyptus grandis TaxID=71139 RepID=UPI00192EE95F|nr:probable polygalacturonase At1g80170 isoform X2 [Eucalyptus grandis]
MDDSVQGRSRSSYENGDNGTSFLQLVLALGSENFMGTLALILAFGSISCGFGFVIVFGDSGFFSVCDYGAVGDGVTDDTGAFLEAWQATCSTQFENPTMIIPDNYTFLVHQLTFSGPCNAKKITFLVLGNINAPTSPRAWTDLDPSSWMTFHGIDQLRVSGFGTIDGQGSKWWNQSCRYHPHLEGCTSLAPTAMKFLSCSASSLNNIKLVNSPQTHVLIRGCRFFDIGNLLIEAPGTSPNTDGIHIQSSQHVSIANAVIGTGDDCISIGDYTSNIYVSSVTCGPGHGVSIGSLGRRGNFVQVENIHVSNVQFKHTTNGARIKTWQVGKGYVRRITFEHLKFDSVKNPIIIDQNYCSIRGACKEMPTGVHISNVAYVGQSGTSSTDVAINLNCSRSVACTRIVLESIELMSANMDRQVTSSCLNAHGNAIGVRASRVSSGVVR